MSHFSVMVVTKTQEYEELEDALQPFHEYECTGTKDQYVVFQDCHDEVLRDWETMTSTAYRSPDGKVYDGYEDVFYREPTIEQEKTVGMGIGCGNGISWTSKDWGDGRGYRAKVRFVPHGFEEFERQVSERYETMEQFADKYHGYNIIENGRIGRYINPNKKWDWWVVGGWWSDWLQLKDGTKVDSAAKGNIDFDAMIHEAKTEAGKKYDEVHKVVAGRTWLSWEECKAAKNRNIKAAREMYLDQPVIKDLLKLNVWLDHDEFLATRDAYIAKKGKAAIVPFALLVDGKWMERGNMGFWAFVSDENPDWDTEFAEILKDISDEMFITIVDCHI